MQKKKQSLDGHPASGRIRGIGAGWGARARAARAQNVSSVEKQTYKCRKHQDKKLISQDEEGSYVIHDADTRQSKRTQDHAISQHDGNLETGGDS